MNLQLSSLSFRLSLRGSKQKGFQRRRFPAPFDRIAGRSLRQLLQRWWYLPRRGIQHGYGQKPKLHKKPSSLKTRRNRRWKLRRQLQNAQTRTATLLSRGSDPVAFSSSRFRKLRNGICRKIRTRRLFGFAPHVASECMCAWTAKRRWYRLSENTFQTRVPPRSLWRISKLL